MPTLAPTPSYNRVTIVFACEREREREIAFMALSVATLEHIVSCRSKLHFMLSFFSLSLSAYLEQFFDL